MPRTRKSETLDKINRELLKYLIKNGRAKLTDLADQLKLSITAVKNRLKKLEDAKFILGYSTRIDFKKIGYPIVAFVKIYTEPDKRGRVIEELIKMKNVIELYEVTGDYDLIAKIAVKNVEDLREILALTMANIDGIKRTSTSLIIREHELSPAKLLEEEENEVRSPNKG